jgi:DNA-binding transcriptional regulator LsrR (DeoR family)
MADYELDMLIKVAELYYLHDMTQQQVANKLHLSRTKVSRMLKAAKEKGIVEIKINYPVETSTRLENLFAEKFHLKEVIIVKGYNDPKEIIWQRVTETAARYLNRIFKNKVMLGVSWGRTLRKVVDALNHSDAGIEVVQLIGNMGSSDVSANEIVRKLADSFHGNYHLLPAPAIVDNESIRDAIISDGTIQKILMMFDKIDVALIGIGDLSGESAFVTSGYLKQDDIEFLRKSGAVGDICGRFYDINGNLCDNCFNRRVIAVTLEQLKKIPHVVGVASGPQKAEAILGALRGGYVDVLVTDEDTAELVLKTHNGSS